MTWATVVGVALAEALATGDEATTGPAPVNEDADTDEDNAAILEEATEGTGATEDTIGGEDDTALLDDAAVEGGATEDATLLDTGGDEAATEEAKTGT